MSFIIRPFRTGGWEVDIMLTLPNGQKFRERRKSPSGSKSATKRWAQEREAFLLQHGPQRRGKKTDEEETVRHVPTIAEFVPMYLDSARADRQKPGTLLAKVLICQNHLIPQLGNVRLDEITEGHVERLKLSLHDHSPKTVNNILAVLNTILKVAVTKSVLDEVPLQIKWLKTMLPKMPFYDFDEYDRLRAAAWKIDPRCALIVLLAGDAGLRCGEIRALLWSSVNFVNDLITVERAYSLDQVLAPKSGKIRTVPMTARLREALLEHRERCEHANVLASDAGEPLTLYRVRSWVNRAQRDAKVLEKGPHTLRHTFCSQLAMTGAHVLEIQALAGHSDLETTQRYMHLSPQALRGAVSRLQGGLVGRFGDGGDGVETAQRRR